jgi:hypothetical protein
MEKKLIPYSVYLPIEYYAKLRLAAQERKASSVIRDAIQMFLDGHDTFTAGYKKGIKDACQVVYDCPEAQLVAVKGKDIGVYLSEQIELLAKEPK